LVTGEQRVTPPNKDAVLFDCIVVCTKAP